MAREAFVDTSGFYALLVKRDDRHAAARDLVSRASKRRGRFITTDYVLDETATLLKARGQEHLVGELFAAVGESKVCRIEWTDPQRFNATTRFFLRRLDQEWSFTDCLSFLVMKELRVRPAFTKDAHFGEGGFEVLLL